MNPTVTVDDILALGPCYTEAELEDLLSPNGMPLLDILDLEQVPASDRVWAAIRLIPVPLALRFLGLALERALRYDNEDAAYYIKFAQKRLINAANTPPGTPENIAIIRSEIARGANNVIWAAGYLRNDERNRQLRDLREIIKETP